MTDSTSKSVASGFCAVRACFRYLALLIGLTLIAGFAMFSYQGSHSNKLMQQRVEDVCKGFSSEIPCHCKYLKPRISLPNASDSNYQPVEINSSYVYSAYLDDRLAPDVDPKALPVVRILTILPRNDTDRAKGSWHCVFWYEIFDLPLIMPVADITYLNVEDTTYRIISTMVLCSLPATFTSSPPYVVSLVSDICELGPQNYLPVIDLIARRRNFQNLTSNGSSTVFWNANKVSNFTICVPPIFGDSIKTLEIIEFIELNRLLGADKFVLYLESPKQELIPCLLEYSKAETVELCKMAHPFKQNDLLYHSHILAQNDCLFRVMYRTRYFTQQDLDEFIVPTQTTDWTTMLDSIHKDMQPEHVDSIASYNFRNLFIPMQEPSNNLSLNESFRVKDYELKTLTKTTCLDKPHPWKQRSKVMGRPERILILHVHLVFDRNLVRKGDVNALVDKRDGLLFHYRHVEEKYSGNTTNRRMWMYQKQLLNNVRLRAMSPGCRV